MFERLGRTVAGRSPLVLGLWVVLLAAGWRLAPSWYNVTQGGDYAFLPDDAPSRRGEELLQRAFPDQYSASSIVLVVRRDEDGAGLSEQDRQFIRQILTPALKGLAGSNAAVVARIRSPDDPGVGALLVSRDNRAALVVVELTTRYRDPRNWDMVAEMERLIDRVRQGPGFPPGLAISLTGSATAGRDVGRAEQKTPMTSRPGPSQS